MEKLKRVFKSPWYTLSHSVLTITPQGRTDVEPRLRERRPLGQSFRAGTFVQEAAEPRWHLLFPLPFLLLLSPTDPHVHIKSLSCALQYLGVTQRLCQDSAPENLQYEPG
jgi:hypothetical protein